MAANMLRTPADRFADLPDWPFAPRYIDHDGLRVHYIDEGPRDAAVTALCLHGNPTWSYLYRRMIPVFVGAGMRVVAPDMIGFGRSDKPADESWHGFERHRAMLMRLVERLGLRDVMLVCQDWGGLFGLTLPHAMPNVFTRLVVMNTGLGVGTVTDGFVRWRSYSNAHPDLDVGRLMMRGKADMSAAEGAAYDAPFPDAPYKAALRAFPNLVPDSDDAPGAAVSREAARFLSSSDWTGESFMAIGLQDPVLGAPPMRRLQALIRGCPPALEIADAGHFVPEWGDPIARAALAAFRLG